MELAVIECPACQGIGTGASIGGMKHGSTDCYRCRRTGRIELSINDGTYIFEGPFPDQARTCFKCRNDVPVGVDLLSVIDYGERRDFCPACIYRMAAREGKNNHG